MTLHNYGTIPIDVYGLMYQQWSKIEQGASFCELEIVQPSGGAVAAVAWEMWLEGAV